MILPGTTKDGRPRISYSQLNSWTSKSAFRGINIGGQEVTQSGKHGYILERMVGYEYPPDPAKESFAPFGDKVEDAICEQDFSGFTDREANVLKSIKPLGVFQKPVEIDFGDFVLTGFIDDCNKTPTKLRDYKTASVNSAKKYYTDEYKQLEIYALERYKRTGKLPTSLEVCVIERIGNPFRGEELKVGDNVWYIEREISKQILDDVEEWVVENTREIAEYYETFLKMNIK